MSRLKLLLRTLTYFRLSNLAVIAGAAISCAILTGAMMVGDSVKLSLRDRTGKTTEREISYQIDTTPQIVIVRENLGL